MGKKLLNSSEKNNGKDCKKINILVVARWPLGGIRTYMKYVYKYFPKKYCITILAPSTHEDEALKKDAIEMGAVLNTYKNTSTKDHLFLKVFSLLYKKRFDLIQSHGFISAFHVYLANQLFKRPHILTVHGILENRYFQGPMARIKMAFLSKVIKNVDVLYSVGDDIYGHLLRKIPSLKKANCNKVVIRNGIDVSLFADYGSPIDDFRKRLGLEDDVFLIGFVGRFIQQKGFNYLIDAINIIESYPISNRNYKVLAVGSGDYLDRYKKVVKERKLEHRFCFMPFQKDLTFIYKNVDMVVMPSIWEACPLQPMEALCAGVPMIASDCIGLREITRGTPVITIPSKSSAALADAIYNFMDSPAKKTFLNFRDTAIKKFDVRNTAQQVHVLFDAIIKYQSKGKFFYDC